MTGATEDPLLRTLTELPLCVGFGVSTPDHVKALKGIADPIGLARLA